jgi:hypothetical protein
MASPSPTLITVADNDWAGRAGDLGGSTAEESKHTTKVRQKRGFTNLKQGNTGP